MRKKIYLLIIIVAAIGVGNLPILERFTVTGQKNGVIVFQEKTERVKEFSIGFTHSVNRTPVNEYYRISHDKLELYKATFYSYGAGMPEAGEYGSSMPKVVNGVVEINDMHREFNKVTYFVGTYANHSLNIGDRHILLVQLVKPQTPVAIEVKRISAAASIRCYFHTRMSLKAAQTIGY